MIKVYLLQYSSKVLDLYNQTGITLYYNNVDITHKIEQSTLFIFIDHTFTNCQLSPTCNISTEMECGTKDQEAYLST